MSHRQDPDTRIMYTGLVDYYDKLMMVIGMEVYMPYMPVTHPKRRDQLRRRFQRRLGVRA